MCRSFAGTAVICEVRDSMVGSGGMASGRILGAIVLDWALLVGESCRVRSSTDSPDILVAGEGELGAP